MMSPGLIAGCMEPVKTIRALTAPVKENIEKVMTTATSP
jgi:hypothetical protein